MSAKFQTTQSPELKTDNLGERMQAEALCHAFAVVGKMIGEGWVNVDFREDGWSVNLRTIVQTVAEVLYDYR
jgi:hypothetical protein